MHHIFLICATLLSQVCWANAPVFMVKDAYARASRGPNSAVFMTIQGDDKPAILIGASVSPHVCSYTEIHTHIQEGDVFKMRKVETLTVPAHGTLVLKPGGDHIMLMQLKQPLEAGQTLSLTLQFKDHPAITLDVPVQSLVAQKH